VRDKRRPRAGDVRADDGNRRAPRRARGQDAAGTGRPAAYGAGDVDPPSLARAAPATGGTRGGASADVRARAGGRLVTDERTLERLIAHYTAEALVGLSSAVDEEARADPRRRLRGPGAGGATLQLARGRGPRHASRQERLVPLRVREAGCDGGAARRRRR